MYIKIGKRTEFTEIQLRGMYSLRAEVFKHKKGWEVQVIDGMELDGYDALDPYYVIAQRPTDNRVGGCWRLIPTVRPYMLEHTFSELLYGQCAPKAESIWELSRFAIIAEQSRSMAFSEITLEVIRKVIEFGINHGIAEFVTVTTPGIERMLRRQGLVIRRYGPPIQVGVERAVAIIIELNKLTLAAVGVVDQEKLQNKELAA
ncbi:acyl-homoserine-lactone synthase [Stutzerimonas nitrititolerans]|uniref:acyl-homoserine-lactone synthase n=1 Tax=Stutzerimonas nitrititolerans TaxID=2482751 RepID=UPI0028997B80|nr:acyl-homoserine-lactone synthase [Stutzerimonas nitrititolerans]